MLPPDRGLNSALHPSDTTVGKLGASTSLPWPLLPQRSASQPGVTLSLAPNTPQLFLLR